MKKPWGTCREVTALVSAREDRDLSMGERTVLRFHAFICGRCERWESQVKFMRESMQAWKNYRD
ncbi:MAG: zf-HC2 domain-containing protein [Casimicrobium sp.]